jgi:hypothetical protein
MSGCSATTATRVVVVTEAEFAVQGLAENESVDAATGQFICPVAPELGGINPALRIPADPRCDIPVELREQAVEAIPSSVSRSRGCSAGLGGGESGGYLLEASWGWD